MLKFREQETIAGLSQLFMSLLGELETKGVLTRPDTVRIFDRAAEGLRSKPDDPINTQAALFVETLSGLARQKN